MCVVLRGGPTLQTTGNPFSALMLAAALLVKLSFMPVGSLARRQRRKSYLVYVP